jgi:superfamily II DNA or RNA helicase
VRPAAGSSHRFAILPVAVLSLSTHELVPFSMAKRSKVECVGHELSSCGQLIVDECHHISARSFERVARAAKACYVTGFSATVERRDGHHPIIFMQCGPVRHRVTVATLQASDHITRRVQVRRTGFVLPGCPGPTKKPELSMTCMKV